MDQAFKGGVCGETKVGKSYFGAAIVKQFDGIVLDFAGVYQYKDDSKVAKYHVSELSRGEAYPACRTAGIDLSKQYFYIKSYSDLEAAIEYVFVYRDTVSQKPNKRIWLVFDDTSMWRWHTALYIQRKNSHKMITKDDWAQATSEMIILFRKLESEFNLLFINQMQDIYKDGENTGERKGRWYPTGIEYALDFVGELWIDWSKMTQHFGVIANRMNWIGAPDYVSDIVNPTPESVFRSLKIPEELW